MILIFFIFILSFQLYADFSYINNSWIYKSFDSGMQIDKYSQAFELTKYVFAMPGKIMYGFFKNLYELNNPSLISVQKETKIPKIIHQIWLGDSIPDCFENFMHSWVKFHGGDEWEYKLWRDADIARLDLINQELYDATDNYGVKSDIARYEIVYRYGGVYVDLDFECLQPLDLFHHAYDFYTGLQPLDSLFIQLGSALFGAKPGHPILFYCINRLKDNWQEKGATRKTGPIHFTKAFYAAAGKDGNCDIAFPASYFYPLGCQDCIVDKNEWIENGAYAVHWWAKSWMPKEYRSESFKTINNDYAIDGWDE